MYEDKLYEDKLYEDKLYGDKLYEDKLYEDKLYEDKLCEDKLYENKLYGGISFDKLCHHLTDWINIAGFVRRAEGHFPSKLPFRCIDFQVVKFITNSK